MSNRVIFAESFGQYRYLLDLIETGSHVIVMGNPDLHDLFEKLFGDSIVLRLYNNKDFSISGERQALEDFWDTNLSFIKNKDIYWMGQGWNGPLFHYLEKLAPKNKLFYISRGDTQLRRPNWWNPKLWVKLLVTKYRYGKHVTLGKFGQDTEVVMLPEKYLREVDIVEAKEADLDRYKSSFYPGKPKVYFMFEDLYEIGEVEDKKTYRYLLWAIQHIIQSHYEDKDILVTYHPNVSNDESLMDIGRTLPKYTPSELLFSDSVEFYIGQCSSGLANLTEGIAISVLDLLNLSSEESKKGIKERLVARQKTTILFPQTFGELEDILSNVTD